MKKLLLLATALFLLGSSSTLAQHTGYERKAFAGRYGLWDRVRCMADSVQVNVANGRYVASSYPLLEMEADLRGDLRAMGAPAFCDPSWTPAPGTLVTLELDVRLEPDENGSLAYFVRLVATMPDVDFVRSSFGQLTSWESSGRLGSTRPDRGREALRSAIGTEVDEFAEFMRKTRAMRD